MSENQPVAWVVGGGGLLGGAVLAETKKSRTPVHRSRVPWSDPGRVVDMLSFTAERLLSTHPEVDLYWCAGAGVVASDEEQLREEVSVLERFVESLIVAHARFPDCRLRVFLASSAGGVYAGCAEPPFSELTSPSPLAPYGRAKIRGEEALSRLASHGISVLIGRIANLYGPGQDAAKPQGIITQLCRAQLLRSPLLIYVPLDTSRDYLFVRDAAAMASAGMRLLAREPAGTRVVKILASHSPTTLASIIGTIHRVSKRRPPTILGTSPYSRYQARDLRFTSVTWPELDRLASTPLPVGIAETHADVAAGLRQAVAR